MEELLKHFNNKEYDIVIQLCSEKIENIKQKCPEIYLIEPYIMLSNALQAIGKFKEALTYLLKAKKIDKTLGNDITIMLSRIQNFNLAIELQHQVLDDLLSSDEKDDVQVIKCMYDIALTYQKNDNALKAKEILEECLKIIKEKSLVQTESTLTHSIIYDLAICLIAFDNHEDSLKLLNAIIELRGPESIHTYLAKGSIAWILYKEDKLDESIILFNEVINNLLGILDEAIAESLGIMYSNLGHVYMKKKDYESALTCYEKSHKTHSKFLGPKHPRSEDVEKYTWKCKHLKGHEIFMCPGCSKIFEKIGSAKYPPCRNTCKQPFCSRQCFDKNHKTHFHNCGSIKK